MQSKGFSRCRLHTENPPSPCFRKGGLGIYEGGFTLLELIISIALIALITILTASAMRLGIRSVDRGEKRIESLERVRTSLNIIDSQIQSEIPISYTDETTKKFYFTGERDSLRFSTNYSIWGGQKGYVIVTYRVISNTHGKQVLTSSEDVIGVGGNRETVLLDSFDQIFFEYFYKGPTDEKGDWVDKWPDEANIPEKIRLHLIKGRGEVTLLFPMRSGGSLVPGVPPPDQPG